MLDIKQRNFESGTLRTNATTITNNTITNNTNNNNTNSCR